MPRVRQVPLSEIHANGRPYYERLFKGGDPTVNPGTATGTPGHWWSTIALRPYIFDHAAAHMGMLGLFGAEASSQLDPKAREIALMRVGFLMASQFVYSQHCKIADVLGIPQAKIDAIQHWNVELDLWTPLERAILAYADAIVLDRGRVPDGVFNALHTLMKDEDIAEITYHIGGYMLHASFCRALRLEWDDVPERVQEVPWPEGTDLVAIKKKRADSDRSNAAEQSHR